MRKGMIRVTDQYFWNFIFGAFFVALVAMGTIILETEIRVAYEDLALLDFILMSLATFRLTRLFVNDAATKCIREQFWDAEVTKGKVLLVKPARGPRRTLADLFSCPWCFGMWAAATVVFAYLLTPYAVLPVIILAIAGVATWIQQLAQLIGWKAEQLKRDVEG